MTAAAPNPQLGQSDDLVALARSILDQALATEQVEVLVS